MAFLKKPVVVLALALILTGWAYHGSGVVAEMVSSAQHFLNSLTAEGQTQARFEFSDEERFNFHFIPRARKGVPFKSMTFAQRKLANAFLATGLSPEGYVKASRIMFLDHILWEMENQSPRRDPDLYYFSVFGEPSSSGRWAWRVEGHHLSLNFTLDNGQVVSTTPAFWGANPAEVRQGPHRGLKVLAEEEALGRALLHSFQGRLQQKAIIDAKAPPDILTGTERTPDLGKPAGVTFSEMNEEQSALLLKLLEVYARRLRPQLAEAELEKIRRAGLDKIHFAWAGGSQPGDAHYYRIHSEDFVIEYDNTQNNANHIHTVWRDFRTDFGRDPLRDHYARHHSHGHGHDHVH